MVVICRAGSEICIPSVLCFLPKKLCETLLAIVQSELVLNLCHFSIRQATPLLMMCIMLTIYALVLPYKSQTANLLELLVQINFIILLLLPSTQLIRETLFSFTPPSMNSSADTAFTNETCTDGLSSIAPITWLLFPFYYLPLLGGVVVAGVYLVLFVRKKVEKKQPEEVSADIESSTYVTYYHRSEVTTTEISIEESTDM